MVLVLGCGRTGTNMITSMIAGSSKLSLDPQFENREIFRNLNRNYSNKYLCKSDVTYMNNYNQLQNLIAKGFKIIFTMRDPRGVIMSKIRRGQPKSSGGDNPGETIHDDATPKTAIQSLTKAYETYKQCKNDYPESVMLVRMEDVIRNPKDTLTSVSEFLNIPYEDTMINFGDRVVNKYKKKRYGKKLDKGQLELWRDWSNVYDGFFTKAGIDMNKHFNTLKPIIEYFKYETE